MVYWKTKVTSQPFSLCYYGSFFFFLVEHSVQNFSNPLLDLFVFNIYGYDLWLFLFYNYMLFFFLEIVSLSCGVRVIESVRLKEEAY